MVTDLTMLNEQQRACILESVDHNVVLLAGAGSGKTFTLVKRAEYLIRDIGVNPENIMMVTFTRKAANEMKERLCKNVPSAENMNVGTIHSICLKYLVEYGEVIDLPWFSVLSDREKKEIISDAIMHSKYSGGYKPWDSKCKKTLNNCAGKIDSFKANLVSVREVEDDPFEDSLVKDAYRYYIEYCEKNRKIDYDDMIIKLIEILGESQKVVDEIRRKVKYLMVDESQDTSRMQNICISMMAGNNNIMMVGDVSQSIYGFRNAKPKYLERYHTENPNTVRMMLEKNYRCPVTIVDAANYLISHNKYENRVVMFSENTLQNKIRCIRSNTPIEEAKRIASEIRVGIVGFDNRPSDYAIIYRTNAYAEYLKIYLEENGIDYVELSKGFFLDTEEVSELLEYCKIYSDPTNEEVFRKIIRRVGCLNLEEVNEIIRRVSLTGKPIYEYLYWYAMQLPVGQKKDRCLRLYRMLSKTPNSLADCIYDLYNKTNHFFTYPDDVIDPNQRIASQNVACLFEKAEEFDKLRFDLSVEDRINYFEEYHRQLHRTKLKNSVVLTTAHSVKGLEFDHVYIAGAIEGVFPHAYAIMEETEEAIEEERRLFYVSMTRAKKELTISVVSKVYVQDTPTPKGPSRFLSEIPKEYLEAST